VLGARVKTARGEVDLVVARGAELVCVEVKSSTSIEGPARYRPGNRFRAPQARRQAHAAREVARSLRWRGPIEVSLYEVWFREGRASGRWHRRCDFLRPGGARESGEE
jgi:hypothetical protein